MSKLAKDPNKQHYFSELPNGERDSLLDRLANRRAPIILWRKGKDESDVESFELEHYDAQHKKLTLRPTKLLKKLFHSHLVNQSVLLKISEGNYHYFSQSLLVVTDTAPVEYCIQMLAPIYVGQQRKNYRLSASNNVTIQIKIGDNVFDGLDISAGGMSFTLDTSLVSAFKAGQELTDITIRLNSYRWTLPHLKIAKIWPLDNDPAGKRPPKSAVGVSFVELPKGLEEDITKAVNSEARGEEVRKMFNLSASTKKAAE